MKRFLFLLLICNFSFAQLTIKGEVVDEYGLLKDANIIVKGTTKGSITDKKGAFEIKAKLKDTLVVSYIGYKTKELVISDKNPLKIELESNIVLDEVLVVAYGCTTECRRISCGGNYCKTIACGVEATGVKIETIESQKKANNTYLFPNPSVNGIFKLNFEEDYKNIDITVSNISGQTILSRSFQNINKQIEVNLSEFPTGIYIINTMADGKMLDTKKAIRG